jgi:hypothetical protein
MACEMYEYYATNIVLERVYSKIYINTDIIFDIDTFKKHCKMELLHDFNITNNNLDKLVDYMYKHKDKHVTVNDAISYST